MSKKELIKRYALFIISLFFSALGVAIAKESRTHKVYIHPLSASTALKKLESR